MRSSRLPARAAHRVHQTRVRIHADVSLNAEQLVVALLTLLRLQDAFARGVFGRTRRDDQRGVHNGAGTQHQALGAQQRVEPRQDLWGQLVFFQQSAKAKDRSLVREQQARELAEPRYVVQ